MLDEPCGGPAERQFFSARPAGGNSGIPTRFGYYAGLRIVRDLAAEMTVEELLNVDIPTAQQLVCRRLDDTGLGVG